MKLIPYTVMVPEHYAVFMKTLDAVLNGAATQSAVSAFEQVIEDEHPEGAFDELFIDGKNVDSKAEYAALVALNKFIRADAVAKMETQPWTLRN